MLFEAGLNTLPGGIQPPFAFEPGSQAQAGVDGQRVRRDGPLEAFAGLVQTPEPMKLLAEQYQQRSIARRKFSRMVKRPLGQRKIQRPHLGNAQLEPQLRDAWEPLDQVMITRQGQAGPAAHQLLLSVLPTRELAWNPLEFLKIGGHEPGRPPLARTWAKCHPGRNQCQKPLTF